MSQQVTFAFAIDERVRIANAGETFGWVAGQYVNRDRTKQFFVEYVNASGRPETGWFRTEQLEAAPAEPEQPA